MLALFKREIESIFFEIFLNSYTMLVILQLVKISAFLMIEKNISKMFLLLRIFL